MSAFSGVYRLTNAESGTVMTMTDPKKPVVCASTGTYDRRSLWRLTRQPNGGYRLTNLMYGLQAHIDNFTVRNVIGSQQGGHVWSIRKGTKSEYTIHSGVGGYVAELSGADSEGNNIVQVSPDKAAKSQRWIIEEASEADTGKPAIPPGIYIIKNVETGTALGLKPGSKDEIAGYAADGSDEQKWSIQSSGNPSYMTIRSVSVGLYAAFPAFDQGAILQLSPTPHDYIINPTETVFSIAPAEKPDHVVDLTGGKEADGTEICLWSDRGASNQRWYFQLA